MAGLGVEHLLFIYFFFNLTRRTEKNITPKKIFRMMVNIRKIKQPLLFDIDWVDVRSDYMELSIDITGF
jgi:hypothetical protein